MLTRSEVLRRLGLVGRQAVERRLPSIDEVPGVSELRSMCHNARTIVGLCDLLGVEGDETREGELIGPGLDDIRVGPGGFILPPE